jgi:predicted AAA+ superfamily ATPase
MSIRNGAIAEQFVGQELIATMGRGRQELNYWLRDGKSTNAEIDYVVVTAGSIVPIEVKACIRNNRPGHFYDCYGGDNVC